MNVPTGEAVPGQAALLALSTGARAIGWAVFVQRELEATGRIVLPSAKRRVPADSASRLAATLDDLTARWHPQSVACCQAWGGRAHPRPEAAGPVAGLLAKPGPVFVALIHGPGSADGG